jgi:Carboxypeptidase regulatory-like domain/TonB-dependent Receptor Plug Domain
MKNIGHTFGIAIAPRYFTARILLLLFFLLTLPLLASAQDTGYISGTVTDKSSAAVADAQVTIKNTAGSLTRSTVTNSDGAYNVSGLPGDTYDLIVVATGFQRFTAQKVVLSVAEKARIDVSLTVGAVTQEVVVTGESVAQVETTSSEISSTITGKQINELELNGRNFTQLVTLSPGVVNQTGQDEGTVGVYGNVAFSMNGGRTEYNNWELDGGDNMDNGSNSTLNVYPNLEAIAEFKVLTSSYGAQYGRNGSGTVEVETKSGTSAFHGSAFEYLRNDLFNARPWEAGNDPDHVKPPYKKHDFGYTVGGPVYIPNHYNSDKKKTFFFWSEEWRREKNPSAVSPQDVPTDAERSGDFTELCAHAPLDCPTGPQVTNFHVTPTATGTALLALIPEPNSTSGNFPDGTPIPAVSSIVSTPTTWREELIRIDHNLTDNYRLTFRYIHDSWSTVVPNPLWGNGTSNFQNVQTNFVGPGTSFVARLNANITPTLLNEFVASYTGDHISLTAIGPVSLGSGFAMGSIFSNGFGGVLPSIELDGNPSYGNSLAQDTGYFPWTNANPTYTYRDNVTKIVGNHTFQFGAYLAFAQKNEENSPNVQGILTFDTTSTFTTGNSFADLLLGNIASYKQWSSKVKYYNRYKLFEPYFQDDWRVSKRLTLNLGLRVSAFGTYRERYQRAFNFDPTAFSPASAPTVADFNDDGSLRQNAGGTINPLNGVVQCGGKGGNLPLVPGSDFPTATIGSNGNAGCLKGHLFNPAPRIGFAFDPKGDGKLAIRGGYGIFFEHTNGNEGNTESLEGSAPLVLTSTQTNIPGYGAIGGAGATLPFFPLTVVSVPNKAVWPYVQQWNLNVQKELPSHIVMSVAYVGSKGTHLTLLTNGNQIFPTAAGDNPFAPGQPITANDCNSFFSPSGTLANGTPVNGQAITNLSVACGASSDPLRTAFPGYSNINQLRDAANSIYHALQIGGSRTVGDLTVSLAYTYSHSIDDSSDRSDTAFVNSYDIAANRASSNFDLRHSFSISYVYGLPFFKGSGLSHKLLGGWQVSGITVAQTGTPFSVTNGSTFGDNAGVANGTGTGSRPDLVGDPNNISAADKAAAAGVFGPLFYSPSAFAIPTGLTFGDVGRNSLYLPGRLNFDFGVSKRFSFTERTGLDFKWETFNLFNHTQFGNGVDSIDSSFSPDNSTFMHLTTAHAPRRMQFGLRLYF